LTQREIGERLGVSQRHVSRILNSAMKKMAVALR
jgi:DNA-directed RNA polymerase specialized sigma subunit